MYKFIYLFIPYILMSQIVDLYRSHYDYNILNLEVKVVEDVVDLYNTKHNKNIKINIKKIKKTSDIKTIIDSTKSLFTAIASSITITRERMKWCTFSTPYLPIKETIFTTKKMQHIPFKSLYGKRIAYLKGTFEETTIKKLQKKYSIIPYGLDSFDRKIELVNSNAVDFFISDNVAMLSVNDIVPILHLNIHKNLGYGILYPKGSPLKKMFDPIIKYYLKSNRFYKRLNEFSNKETANYFIKHVKNATL